MPDDFLSSTSTSGRLSVGGVSTGNLEISGDTDWFRISLVAGRTYQFDLRGSWTSDGTLYDPYMSLRNSSGTKVIEIDDGGVGYNSRFTFTATYSGYYYVAAGSNNNGTGTYEVAATDVTPVSLPDLDVQNAGDSYPPSLSATSVTAGQSVTLTYRLSNWGPGSAPSSTTGIYRSTDGTISTGDTRIGTASDASLSANTGRSETYTIDTTGWAPGTYYIGAVADYANAITEGNETNNASSGVRLVVNAPGTGTWTQPIALTQSPLAGVAISVNQGYGGETSHHSNHGQHSIDLRAAVGTDVLAVVSGEVVATGGSASASTGIYLTIRGDNGLYVSYFHLSQVLVSSGRVSAGQHIAESGATGIYGGQPVPAHLHIQFGDRLSDSGNVAWSSSTTNGVPAAFLASFFSGTNASETAGWVNVLNPSSIRPTDIFGTGAANLIDGSRDDDRLVGSSIGERMFGGGGHDILDGAGGNDTLVGGTGNDNLVGGSGNDVLVGWVGADALNGGTGTDYADYRNSTGVTVALDGSLTATGHAAGDTFTSIEVILGSNTGADRIRGDQNSNVLFGQGGNDTLEGQAGNDRLRGGTGQDTLYGGAGVDAFQYRARNEGGDRIMDWDTGGSADRFQFYGPAFNNLAAGQLGSQHFRAGTTNAAGDSNDYFIFRTTDHTLWFDPDGSGSQSPILMADLQAGAVVTAADIFMWG